MAHWTNIIKPNPHAGIKPYVATMILLGWIVAALIGWLLQPFDVLPTPLEVLQAFPKLVTDRDLLPNLGVSIWTNVKALALTTALSLLIAYGGCVPLFTPIRSFVALIKFWGLSGVTLVFLLVLHTDSRMKVGLLVFGMIGFFVAGLMMAIANIPNSKYDYGRTLGMNEFGILWNIVIRGTRPDIWDAVIINNAMGWVLLSQLELSYRSEGGLGVMFDGLKRAGDYAGIGAVQITIALTGSLTTLLLYSLKRMTCKYFFLKTDKRKA